MEGMNPSWTYGVLIKLLDFDLAAAATEAWNACNDFPSRMRMDNDRKTCFALAAVGYGHLDALEFLVKQQFEPDRGASAQERIRFAILRHSDFSGTKREIAAVFRRHKESLIFDPETRKFVIAKNAGSSSTETEPDR